MRPKPKGLLSVSWRLARRTLARDMMLPPASERLLAASAVAATLPVDRPTANLMRDSSRLAAMPVSDPTVPQASRRLASVSPPWRLTIFSHKRV